MYYVSIFQVYDAGGAFTYMEVESDDDSSDSEDDYVQVVELVDQNQDGAAAKNTTDTLTSTPQLKVVVLNEDGLRCQDPSK